MFEIINCASGIEVHVGSYPTKVEAQVVFRERNKHLFDKKFAEANNLLNTSTFDIILDKDGHFVDPIK